MSAKELKYNFPFLVLESIRNNRSFARLETEFLFYKMKISKYIKRCPNCNRVFGSSKKQCYCSEKCLKEYSEKNKHCKYCKKEFIAQHKGQRYCSKKCKMQMQKIFVRRQQTKKYNPKIFYTKVCKVCNSSFHTRNNLSTVCSEVCRNEINFEKLKLFNVFERDNFRCAYCGKTSYEDGVKLIVEHIFPRSKGGTNEGHNIITACSDCNNRKRDKIMDWNVILTLWQVVEKRNRDKNINWNSLKDIFDKQYKTVT